MKQERLKINRMRGRGTSTFVQLPDDDCLRTRKTGRCTLPPSLIAAQFNFHLQLQMLAHFLISYAYNYNNLNRLNQSADSELVWENKTVT